MTFREISKLLAKDGWILKTVKGSHFQYIHPHKSGKVTVPNHKGDLDIKTANAILKQAGIKQ